jgi:hypothetical protein
MKKSIGPYTFELAGTQVLVRETATGMLLKAMDYKAYECVDKFKAICKHWEAKFKVTVAS